MTALNMVITAAIVSALIYATWEVVEVLRATKRPWEKDEDDNANA